MSAKFTQRVKVIFDIANAEAKRSGHKEIGTEHILIALIVEGSGIAANVLKNANLSLHNLREALNSVCPPKPDIDNPVEDLLPQTPAAKKVIEYALEEANILKHNYVGTEHLLLGILRVQNGNALRILDSLNICLNGLREDVMLLLGQGAKQKSGSEEESQD